MSPIRSRWCSFVSFYTIYLNLPIAAAGADSKNEQWLSARPVPGGPAATGLNSPKSASGGDLCRDSVLDSACFMGRFKSVATQFYRNCGQTLLYDSHILCVEWRSGTQSELELCTNPMILYVFAGKSKMNAGISSGCPSFLQIGGEPTRPLFFDEIEVIFQPKLIDPGHDRPTITSYTFLAVSLKTRLNFLSSMTRLGNSTPSKYSSVSRC